MLVASDANRWAPRDGCPGSALKQSTQERAPDTQDQIDGKEFHALAAQMIQSMATSSPPPVCDDSEIYDGAKVYAENVAGVMMQTGCLNPMIEQRVELDFIHPNIKPGYIDCLLFDDKAGHVYIWDGKFGRSQVDAFENFQLILYALAFLNEAGIDTIKAQYVTVHLRIAQPRAYHVGGAVDEWVVNARDLMVYGNQVLSSAEEASKDDPACNSGEHCKNCAARHDCEAALRGGVQLFEASTGSTPLNMSPQALGTQLDIVTRAFKQMKTLKEGYTAQVEAFVKKGIDVPGYTVAETFGNLQWKDEENVAEAFHAFGIDVTKKPQLITPTQAKARFNLDTSVISAYTEKRTKGYKVVAQNSNDIKKVFQ
jgi:hypothetical protein